MVIGTDDVGNLTDKQRLDRRATVEYGLGQVDGNAPVCIRSGRCASILQRTMRRGEPETAAKAIIYASTDLSDFEADRKLGAAALIDTIEFVKSPTSWWNQRTEDQGSQSRLSQMEGVICPSRQKSSQA